MSSSSAVEAAALPHPRLPISARSALLTTLLEFAHPRDEPVWTTTLVESLHLLDIEEKAVRQALTRVAIEGHLTSERVGRRTRWSLTDEGRELLEMNDGRIHRATREAPRWDGSWLLLSVSIPESQRQLRHHLRSRLHALGLGSPAPGLWVTPEQGLLGQVERVVDDLAIRDRTSSWIGPSAPIGDPTKLVAAAWDLDAVRLAHIDFVRRFSGHAPTDLEEAFAGQVRLVHAWRRVVLVDPRLPLELLEPQWPGVLAASTFHHLHEAWGRRAQEQWETMRSLADPLG